jgi:hypothetical protein
MTADPKPAPDIADQIADMMDAAGYGHLQAGLFYHPTTGVLLVECMGGPLDYNTFEVPLVDLLADAIKARLKTRGGDLPAPDGDGHTWDPDLVRDLLAALEAPGPRVNATTMTPDERQAFIKAHTVLRKPV